MSVQTRILWIVTSFVFISKFYKVPKRKKGIQARSSEEGREGVEFGELHLSNLITTE